MLAIAALIVVLMAIPVSLLPKRFRGVLTMTAACALVFVGAAVAFLEVGPKDYLVRFPFLTNVLHPYLIALYAFIAVIYTSAVMLGFVIRACFRWPRSFERGGGSE